MMKWIIGIIILALAGWFAWQSGWLRSAAPQQANVPAPQQEQQTSTTGLPTAQTDTSDDAIVQDSVSLDAQIGQLGNDSGAINQGVNDQATPQSY